MRMPTGLPVRVFTLLLAALAVIPVFRAETANAQSPSVSISFTHDMVGRGLNTRLTISFNDLPDALDFRYQIKLERKRQRIVAQCQLMFNLRGSEQLSLPGKAKFQGSHV